jgi:hypothetical protein
MPPVIKGCCLRPFFHRMTRAVTTVVTWSGREWCCFSLERSVTTQLYSERSCGVCCHPAMGKLKAWQTTICELNETSDAETLTNGHERLCVRYAYLYRDVKDWL